MRFPASPPRSVVLRPESRGSLRIKSADPQVAPEIRINYLATETDRRAFIDGIQILRNILAAPALKSYCVEEVDPGAKIVSDEDLLEFCRRTGSTVYHPTSTCRMGNDPLRRRRPAAEGPRHRWPARGRCLDHAGSDVGQHQRADHHDRGEGVGHDLGGCEVGTTVDRGISPSNRRHIREADDPVRRDVGSLVVTGCPPSRA